MRRIAPFALALTVAASAIAAHARSQASAPTVVAVHATCCTVPPMCDPSDPNCKPGSGK